MRTSHIEIQKRINDEKSRITDKELFASRAYAAYLTDIAEATSKRYKRKIRVRTYWDENPDSEVAYTDNRDITINAGNFLTQSFPTRKLRADSITGLNAHEIGHILFTDFTLSNIYFETLESGGMYPFEPTGLEPNDDESLSEIKAAFASGDKIAREVIASSAGIILNILEDVYVEMRMCDTFPGTFRTCILLNNLRVPELMSSITEQIDSGAYGFSIMMNLMMQYCKSGDINNRDSYSGEYLDALYECIPETDNSVYDDDVKTRYMAANLIVVKLWKYIKPLIEKAEENRKKEIETKTKTTGGDGTDEALKKLLSELSDQIVSAGKAPSGKGKPAKAEKVEHGKAALEETKKDILQLFDKSFSLPPVKTDSIEEGSGGSVTRDNEYRGSDCTSAEDDINRVLTRIAEDRVNMEMETELAAELQAEADKIRFGNAHKGVHIIIHRMIPPPVSMTERYQKVSPPLLRLSKRMQERVSQILNDKRQGGKQTNLLMGKRFNARDVVKDDGHIFYNNRLPQELPELVVAVLNDESGSMESNDRITSAKAASIVIHDFCIGLNIPIMIYGHSTTGYSGKSVDLYAYAEFDSRDNKDRYRLMDISARDNNRDGAALRYVAERLVKRPEENKILIQICDGQPCDSGYYGTEAEADLRGIKREYTNKGITMFTAAIGDDKENIKRIYGNGYLDITDLNRLPLNLTLLISNYIK